MATKVTIDANDAPDLVAQANADATPTGLSALSGGEKAKGTAAAERGTMFDLLKDSDDVIDMGAGDDIFVFAKDSTLSDINGIVKMGDGGTDVVYLSYQITDYAFTLRSDGGIKIEYIGGEHGELGKGDAVTFYGAENFVFRNVDDATGATYASTNFDHDALASLITAAGG